MNAADRQRPPPGELFLDHVSHFVPDLGTAAALLESLGFTVTPVSAQATQSGPAGTSNVCVMLKEGYLECLAPTADTPNARRLRASMARYRGVHLCCFGTPDAEGEHRRLRAHGFEPQELVHLRRRIGGRDARFHVVRPGPKTMPEGRIQFVQHLAPQALWRPRWLRHANGVSGLAAALIVAADPVAVTARYARFAALLPRGPRLLTDRGALLFKTRAEWRKLLGAAPAAPALAGYVLACRDPAALARRCRRAGVSLQRLGALYAARLPRELGSCWLFGRKSDLARYLANPDTHGR